MRRRLVGAIAGVAIVTLLVYAGPRAFMIADLVRRQEQRSLDRSAQVVATAVDRRLADDEAVDAAVLRALAVDGEEVEATLPDGTKVATGLLEPGTQTLEATHPLIGDGRVTVRLRSQVVEERITDALVPVVIFGTAGLLVAVALAMILSRRLVRPFTDLADHAGQIAVDEGHAPRSGIPEADQLADALDESRIQVRELLAREREFSSNASHQLRTPLAALRLRLEDLTLWPNVDPEVRHELDTSLGEIDRLSGTITDLLEFARRGGLGAWSEFDVCDAVTSVVERWTGPFEAADRRLVVTPCADRPLVATSEQALRQVLDVLLENALSHGRGVVEVQVQVDQTRVALRVADEGTVDRTVTGRLFERSVRSASSGGSGIGLSLAQTIAESAGARLGLMSSDPTVFELTFPLSERAAEVADAQLS